MNLIGGSTNVYYDIFNNMTDHGSYDYYCDAFNQRIKKVEADTTTYYVTSGAQILAEYDNNGELLAEYVYDARGIVTKYNLTEGHRWFFKDHLGSTRQVNDDELKQDYLPYGDEKNAAGDETAFRFSGKELDNGTDLYYFGARYYDQTLGRWYVPDPAGQGFSPYAYCGNNPAINVDPDGELWFLAAGLYALQSGYVSGKINQANGGGFGEGFWSGFGTSLAGSAVGYGIGQMFAPAGGLPGFLIRGGTSYVVGGVMSGGDFNHPFNIVGSVFSGIAGAYEGYNRAITSNRNPVTGSRITGLTGGGIVHPAEYVQYPWEVEYEGVILRGYYIRDKNQKIVSKQLFNASGEPLYTPGGDFRNDLVHPSLSALRDVGVWDPTLIATVKLTSSVFGLKAKPWMSKSGLGLHIEKNGNPWFGADWNKFKVGGKLYNLPHWHSGLTKGAYAKHRPWTWPYGKGLLERY